MKKTHIVSISVSTDDETLASIVFAELVSALAKRRGMQVSAAKNSYTDEELHEDDYEPKEQLLPIMLETEVPDEMITEVLMDRGYSRFFVENAIKVIREAGYGFHERKTP